MRHISITPVLAGLFACALAACGGQGDSRNEAAAVNGIANAAAPTQRTLAAELDARDDLGTVHAIADNAELDEVLEGVGPYTVFAPTNAAFTALGQERSEALRGEAMRPQAVALLRAHIVPGLVSRSDIAAALDRGNGRAQMRNMAGGMLSFARDGDAIVVSTEGARGRITGDEVVASNGAIQPVDGLLRPSEEAAR